jgi:GT2 family glycosyltransferase
MGALGATSAPPFEVSVLFVNYNTWRELAAALESLRAHPPARAGQPVSYEAIVVDNASPQPPGEWEPRIRACLADMNGTLIMHGENGGYSKGMNVAFRVSRGRYVLVSNPDVIYAERCIERLLEHLERDPSAGTTAPEIFWDEGFECRLPPNILPTLADLGRLTLAALSPRAVRAYTERRVVDALRVWDAREPVELAMLSGCCFLIERGFFERLGLFDERFPLYYEDTDLSLRIKRAGKRIVQVAGARLVHLYNRSGQTDHALTMSRYWKSRRLYYAKWYGRLGAWAIDLSGRLLGTRWGKARQALPRQPRIADLGQHHDKPEIRLGRRCERFLIEVSLDPSFYLAAGVFGSGESWKPSDALFRNFGPTTFYFRACEVVGGRAVQIGVWSYTLVYPPVPYPRQEQASAAR